MRDAGAWDGKPKGPAAPGGSENGLALAALGGQQGGPNGQLMGGGDSMLWLPPKALLCGSRGHGSGGADMEGARVLLLTGMAELEQGRREPAREGLGGGSGERVGCSTSVGWQLYCCGGRLWLSSAHAVCACDPATCKAMHADTCMSAHVHMLAA